MGFKGWISAFVAIMSLGCTDDPIGTNKKVRPDKQKRNDICKANCKPAPRFFSDLEFSTTYNQKLNELRFNYLISEVQKLANENRYHLYRLYIVPKKWNKQTSCPVNKTCSKQLNIYFLEENSYSLNNNDERVNINSKIISSGFWELLPQSIRLSSDDFLTLSEYSLGKTASTLSLKKPIQFETKSLNKINFEMKSSLYIHEDVLKRINLK